MLTVERKLEENPLEVLLNLLERKNLDISNFSLAQVADGYLNYLNHFKNQDKILNNISEFLWVASKLALIKSRILISKFELEVDLELEENSDELKKRLFEYSKFKNLSKKLDLKLREEEELFSRKEIFFTDRNFSINFDKDDLKFFFINLMDNFNKENTLKYEEKSLKEVAKIEEKIFQIKELLKKIEKFKFSEIIKDKSNKNETVISFLSILELIKQGIIEVKQKSCFQEINITER